MATASVFIVRLCNTTQNQKTKLRLLCKLYSFPTASLLRACVPCGGRAAPRGRRPLLRSLTCIHPRHRTRGFEPLRVPLL